MLTIRSTGGVYVRRDPGYDCEGRPDLRLKWTGKSREFFTDEAKLAILLYNGESCPPVPPLANPDLPLSELWNVIKPHPIPVKDPDGDYCEYLWYDLQKYGRNEPYHFFLCPYAELPVELRERIFEPALDFLQYKQTIPYEPPDLWEFLHFGLGLSTRAGWVQLVIDILVHYQAVEYGSAQGFCGWYGWDHSYVGLVRIPCPETTAQITKWAQGFVHTVLYEGTF